MTRNWSLAQEVAARQREKGLSLSSKSKLSSWKNEYYLSAEYQELAARKYQGKMLAGETMIYLPENPKPPRTSTRPTQTPTLAQPPRDE